ncbi:MAG: SLC13 family permease [Alphaproteobacteria bacterium]
MPVVEPTIQMWAIFALIAAMTVLYVLEMVALELTSLGILLALLVLFHALPVPGPDGANLLDAERLLQGFADPALITVLALLVIGQGMARTGALDRTARFVTAAGGGHPWRSTGLALGFVLGISAFLNNTPVVVIFIPIMQALAERLDRSPSGMMIPLSFAAILGGMTTLIGSSTNLLVSSSLVEVGEKGFGFFGFTVPGLALALPGLAYVLLIAPRLLPDRASLAGALIGSGGRQFIAQLTVAEGSRLAGESAVGGFFPRLQDMTVRLIQRDEHAFVPPFEGITIRPGDVIVVAATRKALSEALAGDRGLLRPEADGTGGDGPEGEEAQRAGDQVLAEAMVTPASRMIGQNLEQIGFRHRYHCIVLGLQRRSRMIRARMTEIRLEAGDVLLIQGHADDIRALRATPDVLLMEWSATELPSPAFARRAGLIFLGVVLMAATEVVPVVVAAVGGAAAMVASGALNVRQAARAIDRRLIMMVGAALALGAALQETGGAAYLAQALLGALEGAGPAVVLSALFLLVALMTNVLSNNACAVLFTPIAVSVAHGLGAEPLVFAVAVVLAANCSFASPIGYQTNLLVMAPGHYRFSDFLGAGLPLVILLWIAFSIFAAWYYGLV